MHSTDPVEDDDIDYAIPMGSIDVRALLGDTLSSLSDALGVDVDEHSSALVAAYEKQLKEGNFEDTTKEDYRVSAWVTLSIILFASDC